MSDGLFEAARLVNGRIEFYRGTEPTPGAAFYHHTPELWKYLVLDETGVREVSQEAKDAIDTSEAQAMADAQAQAIAAAEANYAAQQAAESAAQAAADAMPFAVSKIKVLRAMQAVGRLSAFVAFLNADSDRKLLWDAAVTLDSNDQMVEDAMVQLAPLLEAMGTTANAFLRSCQSDLMSI